jgi:PadR family transcriptional regulator, regulatory protein PadR
MASVDISKALPLREPTFFILTALAEGPLHGYGILGAVEEMSSGRVRLRAGTLYGALARLEGDGYVELDREESEGGPPRRYYRLTAPGRALLAAEAERQASNAALVRARLRPALG